MPCHPAQVTCPFYQQRAQMEQVTCPFSLQRVQMGQVTCPFSEQRVHKAQVTCPIFALSAPLANASRGVGSGHE